MSAHPELGVGASRVGVLVGEARDEGGGSVLAPLVVLHRAAQPQQPLRRRRGGLGLRLRLRLRRSKRWWVLHLGGDLS